MEDTVADESRRLGRKNPHLEEEIQDLKMSAQNHEASKNPRFSCRSSTSCSPLSLKTRGCGKDGVLYRSNSKKNLGKLFWRCRDWKDKGTCGFFEWDRGIAVEDDMEGSSNLNEGLNFRQDMNDIMKKKKIARLREDIDEMVQKAIVKFREDMKGIMRLITAAE